MFWNPALLEKPTTALTVTSDDAEPSQDTTILDPMMQLLIIERPQSNIFR
jgi:hypothetical protein